MKNKDKYEYLKAFYKAELKPKVLSNAEFWEKEMSSFIETFYDKIVSKEYEVDCLPGYGNEDPYIKITVDYSVPLEYRRKIGNSEVVSNRPEWFVNKAMLKLDEIFNFKDMKTYLHYTTLVKNYSTKNPNQYILYFKF